MAQCTVSGMRMELFAEGTPCALLVHYAAQASVPELPIDLGEAGADEPSGGAADETDLQAEVHAAPGVHVSDDEARDADDLQHAIEVDRLRKLLQKTLLL